MDWKNQQFNEPSQGPFHRFRQIAKSDGSGFGRRILPGFQFRISKLYTCPPLEEMAEDPVYQNYVFPFYKELKKELAEERTRAEKAEKRLLRAAQAMLAAGMDTADVIIHTGLPAGEIAALKM